VAPPKKPLKTAWSVFFAGHVLTVIMNQQHQSAKASKAFCSRVAVSRTCRNQLCCSLQLPAAAPDCVVASLGVDEFVSEQVRRRIRRTRWGRRRRPASTTTSCRCPGVLAAEAGLWWCKKQSSRPERQRWSRLDSLPSCRRWPWTRSAGLVVTSSVVLVFCCEFTKEDSSTKYAWHTTKKSVA